MKTLTLFAIFVAGILSCGSGGADSGNPARGFGEQSDLSRVQRSAQGGFEVSYTVVPDPIPLNDYFELLVSVLELEESSEELLVEVDARMPAHNHGMNVLPSLTSIQRGQWTASGMLFHMPGHWEITVRMTRGSALDTAIFNVILDV